MIAGTIRILLRHDLALCATRGPGAPGGHCIGSAGSGTNWCRYLSRPPAPV